MFGTLGESADRPVRDYSIGTEELGTLLTDLSKRRTQRPVVLSSIDRVDILLGRSGAKEAGRENYDRACEEWLAAMR